MLYNELAHAFDTSIALRDRLSDDLSLTVRANFGTVLIASMLGRRLSSTPADAQNREDSAPSPGRSLARLDPIHRRSSEQKRYGASVDVTEAPLVCVSPTFSDRGESGYRTPWSTNILTARKPGNTGYPGPHKHTPAITSPPTNGSGESPETRRTSAGAPTRTATREHANRERTGRAGRGPTRAGRRTTLAHRSSG